MQYENLDLWQRSCELSSTVYKSLASLKDYGFKDQITRSCLSVPSNIAEGLERYTPQEKFRFLTIAKGSLGEFKTQTYVGMKVGYISKESGDAWLKESEEISKMIGGFMKYLKTKL
ncbi:four helix bundle protein [Thalassotalea psychrophila]|uniref:Four helix bundle protein n=1 Tax=Thalassotalea psychrophila TaxID=3065647 RepID=A0ABY9TQS6_9GAMM|nr:four helix bundle protein [Colwelliaceae bacterium SQ149]